MRRWASEGIFGRGMTLAWSVVSFPHICKWRRCACADVVSIHLKTWKFFVQKETSPALSLFAQQLKHLLGQPALTRPFVVDGSPLDADVFIIGFNAASVPSEDFWQFWNDEFGFDLEQWRKSYESDRARPSQTRLRLNRLRDALGSHVLETNVFDIASKTQSALKPQDRRTSVLGLLLERGSPKVIVTHGNEAARQVGTYLKLEEGLPSEFTTISLGTRSVAVCAVSHFSRGWSYERIDQLGKAIVAQRAQLP